VLIPERLYKYQPFSAQALQNLKSQILYFGSPLHFNDPYDCALLPRIKDISDSEVEQVRQHYLSDPRLDAPKRLRLEVSSVAELRAMFVKAGNRVLAQQVEEFPTLRGVACFSEKNDSLLMWSHYADHCRGFCLGFSMRDSELTNKLMKVSYTQEMPVIDVVPMLCNKDFGQVFELYCTKGVDWEYEAEWRGMHVKAGTEYVYPSEILTDIYFGPNMPFPAFEIIALILAGQNENVRLWNGHRSKSKFAVEFERVSYTPYLEAKRKGLIKP
jgi:hypothetical protein